MLERNEVESTEWISVGIAAAALIVSCLTALFSLRQNFNFAGASAAIAWRQQVLDLYDRGLEPEQIRAIMLLEDGGAGYEASNGSIDAILREVPRLPAIDAA
jgi:hypothetical protein